MRVLVFLVLSIATISHGLPPSVTFDGRVLAAVENPAVAGFSVYRAAADGIVYELTLRRVKNPGIDWHSVAEGVVAALKKKPLVLPLKIRSGDSDRFILVDCAFSRTTPDVIEYVVLKSYLSADDVIVSVDVRIRHSGLSPTFVEHVRKERDRFVEEFEKTEGLLR